MTLLPLLRDCYTSHGNIVDAGLVRSATLDPDSDAPGAAISGVPVRYIASITVQAPTSDDAVNAHLLAQIENRLLGHPSISRVHLKLLPPLFNIL